MEALKIRGGKPLKGSIEVSGAKNAITKLLVASLISDKKCIFTNVPDILEVDTTLSFCSELGMDYTWDKEKKIIEVCTKTLSSVYIPQRFSGANRIPILAIGALLGRTNDDIIVPTAGGCRIGKRPIDFHIAALEQLGAHIEYRNMKKEGAYFAHAHHGLKGTLITLPYPSMGATENTILAACRAKGMTVIKNAAIEPEVIDLILFLQKLGVRITVDTDRTICIHETQTFREVKHHVLTDRLQVASFAMAAIATNGRVFIKGAKQRDLIPFLNKLIELGAGFDVEEGGITFFGAKKLSGGLHIETDVYPGFATDWQQPFVVLLTQAEGLSLIHETVYENRFGYTDTLLAMGADINLFNHCLGSKPCRFAHKNYPHSLTVKGKTPLVGGTIEVPDLRAGFAYVLAALIAEGESHLLNLDYLDRGYEALHTKLESIGADITRIHTEELIPLTT